MVSLTTLGSGRAFLALDILEHFLWNEKNISVLKDVNVKKKYCLPAYGKSVLVYSESRFAVKL